MNTTPQGGNQGNILIRPVRPCTIKDKLAKSCKGKAKEDN